MSLYVVGLSHAGVGAAASRTSELADDSGVALELVDAATKTLPLNTTDGMDLSCSSSLDVIEIGRTIWLFSNVLES